MLHALRVNFENFGHTTKNKIFRLKHFVSSIKILGATGLSGLWI